MTEQSDRLGHEHGQHIVCVAKQLPAVAHDTDLEGYSYITQEKRSKDPCGQYAYGVRKKRKVVMAWVEKMVVMEESRTLNERVEQMSCESEEMPWELKRTDAMRE